MSKKTLVQVEAAKIQDYIFGSNNLQQNIGASELVRLSSTLWVSDALDVLGLQHNARWDQKNSQLNLEEITEDLQAEVIYSGGGGALILFDGESAGVSKDFIRLLTKKAIQQARGMTLLVEQIEMDWGSDVLAEKHIALRKKIAAQKSSRMPDKPLAGLAVTAACAYTGLPAVGRDEGTGQLISTVVQHKLDQMHPGNVSLRKIFPLLQEKEDLDFVYNFDQFGERGESSYIAVVHIDGNNMGRRFYEIAQKHPTPADNLPYIEQLRKFSQAVQHQSLQAIRSTANLLEESLVLVDDQWKYGGVVQANEKQGKRLLPFRPIVFGGDDTTFVTDGRLGMTLAKHFLDQIISQELPGPTASDAGELLYACAGVAIAKTHYPFSRTYDLSLDLCGKAKHLVKEKSSDGKGCGLDWHVATTGEIHDLDQIRSREYTSDKSHSMLMRPLLVQENGNWRTWQVFEDTVLEFQNNEAWAQHRNKLIDLQKALRCGPDEIKNFLLRYRQPQLPDIPNYPIMAVEGWHSEYCGYYDAIEALDYFVPLSKGE